MSTTNTTDEITASDEVPCLACPHCEKRVKPWLLAYVEGWHGLRAQWTEEQRAWYYEMYAVLDSFARDFAFTPKPNDQSLARRASDSQ